MSPLPRSQTPAEMAASRIADPAWRWSEDPWSAVSDAVSKAANHDIAGRAADSQYWTWVACHLVDSALNVKVYRGAVLSGLVDAHGEPRA